MPLTKLITSNLNDNALTEQNFSFNSITGTKIADKTLINANFANNTINPSSLQNLTVLNNNTEDLVFNSSGALSITENLNRSSGRLITYFLGAGYFVTNSFDWLAGCYCDFTPTSNTSYIRFSCKWGTGHYNAHTISHLIFYANGTEITRFSSSDYVDERTCHFERIVPSWGTTSGRIGLQIARHGSGNQHQFFATNWWEGAGYNLDGGTVGNRAIQGECIVEEVPNRSRTTISTGTTYSQGIIATGGDVIYEQGDYRIHVFENSGTFTISQLGNDAIWGNRIWYLTVAGGGGGGSDMGGGGGAGGVVENQHFIATTGNYTVTVGAGGAGSTGVYGSNPVPGFTGGNSRFGTTEIAVGGGGGGSGHSTPPYSSSSTRATAGGSGGGASAVSSSTGQLYGAAGTPGQGTFGGLCGIQGGNSYYGGGGGGGGVNNSIRSVSYTFGVDGLGGVYGGHGGIGCHSMILGIPKYFAGGGGSASHTGPAAGQGGVGGGGGGSRWDDTWCQGGGGGQAGYSPASFSSAFYNWRWLWDSAGEGGFSGSGSAVRGGNALVNTGGGGGGANHQSNQGGAGAKGVVIVRYRFTPSTSTGLLGTINNPAANALQILAARPGAPSGNYYILIDGESVPIYCDMTNQGGGWMLVGSGREGIDGTAWWNNGGAGNYYEGLTSANLGASVSNYVPRYLPASAVRGMCGGNTWNEIELIVNRVVLNDSLYFRSSGNTNMFGWADFNPGLANSVSSSSSINNQVSLTYNRYTSPWLAGSNAYGATNGYWVDTYYAPTSNDINRSFTWTWSVHGGYSGWSAGASVTNGFQYTTEGHAIQHVNIFAR